MAQSLILTRDQLAVICHNDQQAIRTLELTLLGINQLPDLEDGIDDNTLAISTLSDLVRPITINLIDPLPAPVGADTTYTLTGGEATEGMKTVFIPATSLVATAAGPFTLTISTGLGTDVLVPIVVSGDTITSGALMFDIHVDDIGNVTTKAWEMSGSNAQGTYVLTYLGVASLEFMDSTLRTTSVGAGAIFRTNSITLTLPYPLVSAPDMVSPTFFINDGGVSTDAKWAGTGTASVTATTAQITGFSFTNSATGYLGALVSGRWRA